MAPNIKKSG